jgi:integral membrane protein (TIGR01906 family)
VHYHSGVKWLSRLATGLFVLALPVLLVTSNVRFLAGEVRLYERGFRDFDSDRRTGLSLAELDRSAANIVDYFEDDRDLLRIRVVDDGEEEALFSSKEVQHMRDVKSLMQAVFRANEVSLAFVLTYIAGVFAWAGAGSLRRLAWEALAGMGVAVACVGVVGLFAAIGFDSTWRQFHELVFSNDLWQLNPATDRLIQMFPEPFWKRETFILAGITIGEAVAIVAVAVACLVFGRRTSTEPRPDAPVRVRPRRRTELSG